MWEFKPVLLNPILGDPQIAHVFLKNVWQGTGSEHGDAQGLCWDTLVQTLFWMGANCGTVSPPKGTCSPHTAWRTRSPHATTGSVWGFSLISYRPVMLPVSQCEGKASDSRSLAEFVSDPVQGCGGRGGTSGIQIRVKRVALYLLGLVLWEARSWFQMEGFWFNVPDTLQTRSLHRWCLSLQSNKNTTMFGWTKGKWIWLLVHRILNRMQSCSGS